MSDSLHNLRRSNSTGKIISHAFTRSGSDSRLPDLNLTCDIEPNLHRSTSKGKILLGNIQSKLKRSEPDEAIPEITRKSSSSIMAVFNKKKKNNMVLTESSKSKSSGQNTPKKKKSK